MRRPIDPPVVITTEFGDVDPNALYGYHSGVDYAKGTGTPVYAPIAGKIVYAQMHPVRGNQVVLFDGAWYHRLMHNSQFNVTVGQQVNEGDVVAYSGATGLATGPHVHWDINNYGIDTVSFSNFVDPFVWLSSNVSSPSSPIGDVVQSYQRRVGANGVNYRKTATTSGEIIEEFAANEVLDLKGYVHGESYSGNDVWFVGKYTGGYLWSGAFTDTSTNGLDDITPAPTPTPQPISYQRTVVTGGVNYRVYPSTTAAIVTTYPAGEVLDFDAYVESEAVDGNNVWYRGRYTGGYAWSGAFTDTSVDGLTKVDLPANPSTPTTPATPTTPVTEYSKRPDISNTLWGIDVSSYQGDIDWTKLRGTIDFAIIRAGHVGKSYGGDQNMADPQLTKNKLGARAAGIPIGYYFYVYLDEDPRTEADYFVNALADVGDDDMECLFLDLEVATPANVNRREWVATFLNDVELVTGKTCHLYMSSDFASKADDLKELMTGKRKLWIANYAKPAGTDLSDQPLGKPVMHQYADNGKLASVEAAVDLNVFYGPLSDFMQLGAPVDAVTIPTLPNPTTGNDNGGQGSGTTTGDTTTKSSFMDVLRDLIKRVIAWFKKGKN